MKKGRNRESRRRERRREAAFTIRAKTCTRKPLTLAEAADLVAAIDKNDTSRFGIVKLSTMELNNFNSIELGWLRMPPRLTLIEYAVRRKRDMIVVSGIFDHCAEGRPTHHQPLTVCL